ncbi:uncharacterized protein LOC116943203 isoform X2 [Petromyzon marinus]|uniref:uncharacterized protein LOC116943203 isoform X2 n=1 Tax=Petromyzon marinus TaxID=7757 RepID=UPI003F6EC392
MDLLECGGNSSSESSSRVVSPTSSMIPPPTCLLQGMAGVVGAAQEIQQDAISPALSPWKRKEARGMAYTIRSCGFQVTLDNREVWERFHSWGTEMILTKTGRRMFPYCRYKVRGLDPQSCYLMAIDVVPVDGHRYRWGEGCWMPIERGKPQIPDSVYVHQEGVAPGSFWMYESISFSEVKLTNTALGQDGVISLIPMFKYVTRFHIIRANKVPRHLRLDADNVHTFIFPQTEFFAVTAYQNTAITHLKISHSPLAWSAEPKSDALNQDEEGGGDGSGRALNSQQGARERVSLGSSGKRDHACMVGTNDRSYDASRGDGSVGMLEEDVLSDKSTNGDGVKRNKSKRDDNSNGCKDQNTLFDIRKVKDEPNDTWQELVENVDPPSSLGGKGESQVVLQNISLSDCLLPAGNSTCKSNLISKVESARAGAMIVPTSVEQDKDPKCPTSHHPLNQNLFPVVRLKQCNISKPTVKLGELPASVLYSYSIPQISLSRSACGDRPLIVLVSESPPHWSEPTDDVKPSKLCLSEGNGADVSDVEERPGKSPLPIQPLPTIPHLNNEAFSGDAMDVTPEDVKPTRSELDLRLLNLTSVPKDDAKETTEHPDAPRGEYVSEKGSVLPALKIGHTGFSSWVWTPPKEGNAPAFQLPPPSFSSVSSRSGSLCSRSRTPSPTPGSSQPRGRRVAPRGLAWEAPTQRADAAATATHHHPRMEHQADRVDVGGVSFFSFSNKEAMLAHRNMEQEKLETLRLSPTLSDNSADHASTGRAQERIQRLQDRLQSALSQFQKSKGNDESGADPRFVSRTGKTNDVTKIKGWQHKFGLQAPASSSGSAPDMNTLGKNRSVFLSDKLDEYLQEEEKLLEQRPNMYASKAAGVTFQTPRTGSTYVRTLDSVLRRRAGPARSAGEREAFAQTCATSPPPPPPLPLSGVTQKRGALAGRGKISTAALRATQKSFKRGTRGKRCSRGGRYGSRGGKYGGRAEVVATAAPLASPKKVTLPSSPPLTPPSLKPARSCPVSGAALVKNANSRNVNTMLLALEELALLDGKHRTYITTDRAERSITTLLTPQMTATGMKKLSVRFAAATTSTSHSSSPSSTPAASGRCQKEFCRLGCVCDSLGEGRAVPAHCGRPECMLECSCPPQARRQAGLTMSKQSGIADSTEPEDESFGRHKRRKRLPTRLSGTHVFYDDVASDCYAFWKLTGRKGHKRKLEGLDSEIHKKRIALWSDMDKSTQGNADSASSNDIPATEAQSSKTELPPTSNEIKAQMRDELMAWALEDGYTCARVREYGPSKRSKANLQCTCGKPHCTEKGPSKSNGKFNKEFKGIIPKEEKLEKQSSTLPKASKKETTGSSSSGGALRPPVPPIQTGSVSFIQANALTPLTVAWNVVPPITPVITPLKQQMHPSGLPQSKLIEIVSNCNWEAERTRVLSAIAEYSGGQSSGDVTTVQLGDLQLEISHLDNKERFKEKRDPSMTVSYLSGLPSHMCCSRVKIIYNPKLSSASSPSKQRAAVASVRSSNSGDNASEEQCQQQNELQLNWLQSQQSSPPLEQQSLQPQQLQKQLLQALNQSEEHVQNEIQNSEKELDLNQQEQTQPHEAKKQPDERLENEQQQPQGVQCHSELQQQNEQPEHEPQNRMQSHPLHHQEQRLEDKPKQQQQQSQPQQNKQQLNQVLLLLPKQQQKNEQQQNLVQPQVECKQALEKDVPSHQELKSVEGARAESSPPVKRSMPCSTARVETSAAGTSAAAKGGTLNNKTLFLTTAAAQAVFNSGAKGVNIIQVNGNFVPQAKLVVGQMGALQAMAPAENQQSMVPKRNLTLRGHSPFLQVNGNMVTHAKLLVGQMGSLQAIGQSVGTAPFVSTVGSPSPGTNLAFHAATRLVTTPLSPVSITLPDGTVALPTAGNNAVTHLIVNKVGTLVAGQSFPKSRNLGPSSATSTHVASGAAAAAPGASGATLAAVVPEATDGPVATAGLVAADGPVSTGGLVAADCPVASGGPVTANRLPTADQPVTDDGPVSADGLLTASGPAAAADVVVACGPVADGELVGTSGPVAASRSLAAGRLVATGELEAAVMSAASGETTADDKDSSSATAGLTRAVTTSASAGVPIAVPFTSSSQAVAVNLSGGLQLPTGIPIVREVSLADPQRLVLIPMQPPQVRPPATPTTNNPIRLPTPAPMLLPGQRMVLQPVKASSGMQLYRHPSGQLVQLVPVRSTRPRHPVSTTAEAPKPPSYTTLRTGLVVHTLNPTGLGLQMRPTGTMLTVARTEVPQVASTTRASFSAPKGVEVATLEASKSSSVKAGQLPADNVTKSTVMPSSEAVSKQTAEKVLSGGPMTALEMCLVEATKNLEIKREKELWKERLRKLDMEMSKEMKVSPEEICQPIKMEVKLEYPTLISPQAMPGGEQTQAEGDAVNPIVAKTASNEDADKTEEEDSVSNKSGSANTAARETAQSMDDESTEMSSDEDSEVDVENLSEGEVSGINYPEQNMDIETVVDTKMKENLSLLRSRVAQKDGMNSQCALHNPEFSNQELSDSSDSDDDILKEVRPNRSSLMRSLQLEKLIALKLLSVPMDEFYDPKASLHTVNERRRRSELRDLFKNIKNLLGFPAHTKMSKYALLKQAHSEIQHLQEQGDRMIAEKNNQLRRRDALLRKLVGMTQKKEDVIIRKLEYICAKHRIKEKLKLTSPKDHDEDIKTYIIPCNQPLRGRPRKIAPKPSSAGYRQHASSQLASEDEPSSPQARILPPPPPLQSQPKRQTKPHSQHETDSSSQPQARYESQLRPSLNGRAQTKSEFEQQPEDQLEIQPQAESQPEAQSKSPLPSQSESQQEPELPSQLQSQIQCEPQPQLEPQPDSHLPPLKPQLEACASGNEDTTATTACTPTIPAAPPLKSSVVSQATKKPSVARSRPLILTRKRPYAVEAHELPSTTTAVATWTNISSSSSSSAATTSSREDSPIHVTSDGLLMTSHGQVLTLKGKMLPSHSNASGTQIIMAQGVLQGKPLAPKGHDKVGAGVPGIASVTIRLQCVNVPTSGVNTVTQALEYRNSCSDTTSSTVTSTSSRPVPSLLSGSPVCSPAAVEFGASVAMVDKAQVSESPEGAPADGSSWAAGKEVPDGKSSTDFMETTETAGQDEVEVPDSDLFKIVSVTSLAVEQSNECRTKGDEVSPLKDGVADNASVARNDTPCETVSVDSVGSLASVMSPDADDAHQDNADISMSDADTEGPVSVSPTHSYKGSTVNPSPPSSPVPLEPLTLSASTRGDNLSKDHPSSCTPASTRTLPTRNSLRAPLSHRPTRLPSMFLASGCTNAASAMGTIPCSVRLPTLSLSQQATLALQAAARCLPDPPSKPTATTGPPASLSSLQVKVSSAVPATVTTTTTTVVAADGEESPGPLSPGAQATTHSLGATTGKKPALRPMPQLLQMQQSKVPRVTSRTPRSLPPLSRVANPPSSLGGDKTPGERSCLD